MENKKRQLLVVDDEEGIRDALNMVLEDLGHIVLTAANGKEALNIIQRYAIDLVITDILMPEGDGLELINSLRKEKPGLKSIVISGGDPQFLSISTCLGADRVLPKPFGQDQLKDMVSELLGSGRQSS